MQKKLAEYMQKQLAVLRVGEAYSTRAALSQIALLAVESTISSDIRSNWISGVHPVAFRKACLAGSSRSANGAGSMVEELATLVDRRDEPETVAMALQALEAIAIDDPSTDSDNDHALAICATSIVPKLVELLVSPVEMLHTRAAAAVAALVENAHAGRMFLGGGAIGPLLTLGRHGSDLARRHALAACATLSLPVACPAFPMAHTQLVLCLPSLMPTPPYAYLALCLPRLGYSTPAGYDCSLLIAMLERLLFRMVGRRSPKVLLAMAILKYVLGLVC